MSGWFSFAKGSDTENDESQAVRALPASWYRSPAMYELERKAIFSKRWLVVSHKARFVEPGDFLRVTEAGFAFFLIKDRRGEIRAYHNVCRHRAYPILQKDVGRVSILACNYHGSSYLRVPQRLRVMTLTIYARVQGWSYGLDGKLAKAPKYQELPSFDKAANGLFSIHVHVDKLGFIWVNLDAEATPTVSWHDDFSKVDLQPRLQGFDMTKYRFDHQWEMDGDFNWKALADNYNEVRRRWRHSKGADTA